MSDNDNAMLWNHRPPQRQRRPGEVVWELLVDHVRWSCELKFHREGYGWDAMVLRDGELAWSRRFLLRAEALGFAEAERQGLEKGGA